MSFEETNRAAMAESSKFRRAAREAKAQRLRELVAKDPELTANALAPRMGMSSSAVSEWARRLGLRLPKSYGKVL